VGLTPNRKCCSSFWSSFAAGPEQLRGKDRGPPSSAKHREELLHEESYDWMERSVVKGFQESRHEYENSMSSSQSNNGFRSRVRNIDGRRCVAQAPR
jgi:hypothetical protein